MYSRSSPKRQSLTPTRCLQPDRLIMLGDEVSSTCWYSRRPVISSAVDRIRTEAGGMWRQICVQVSGSRGVWAVPRSWPVGGQGASVGSWDSKITCRRATERGKVHHINTALLLSGGVMSRRDVIVINTVHSLVLYNTWYFSRVHRFWNKTGKIRPIWAYPCRVGQLDSRVMGPIPDGSFGFWTIFR